MLNIQELIAQGETITVEFKRDQELGQPDAYVRARNFESLQMEQMVLQYVHAHGKITRREVVNLCRITDRQANYMLKKLTDRGTLKRVGKGKATSYEIEQSQN